MRRFLLMLLTFLFAAASALAAPVTLAADLTGEICYPEGSTAENAAYVYRYQYPEAAVADEVGQMINDFYAYMVSDALDFGAPIAAESMENSDVQGYTNITSQVTCNNEDFFSVKVITESFQGAEIGQIWSGHTFALTGDKAGSAIALPFLLGLMDAGESDTWTQDRATSKANTFIWDLVWNIIEEQRADGTVAYYDDVTRESLEGLFYPEQDFYLDENGNPVFYLQAGDFAATSEGVITFPFSMDELLDEL